MNIRQSKRALSGQLRGPVAAMGFNESEPLLFLRFPAGNIQQDLVFTPREKLPGVFAFGAGVGIRFAEVEAIIGAGADDQFKSTVGMPIHLLREDKSYFEWEFLAEEDLQEVVRSVVENVELYAIPFLNRFSHLPSVRQTLESHSPRDHFVLSPESRVVVLAGILCVMEGHDSAIQLLNSELTKRAGRPAKYRTELRLLKTKIERLRTQSQHEGVSS